MDGLVFFILCLIVLFALFSIIAFINSDEKNEDENDEEYYSDNEEDGGDHSPPSHSYSSRREEPESVEYVPQRLGGSGWLTAGNSFSNPSSAQASADYMRTKDPKGTYRVAMKVNGRIVGGF